MQQIIIEVGSTNTKIDSYDGKKVERLNNIPILFKEHYQKTNMIDEKDFAILTNEVNKLKNDYDNIFVCGTSIFRELNPDKKENFINSFYDKTKLDFHIISQEEENELTVLGATRNIKQKACIFIGGGGSTEIAVYDKGIIETANTDIGVVDVLNKYPDLKDDIAQTPINEVITYLKPILKLPKNKSDILILAGGSHEMFARVAGFKFVDNTLYDDINAPIMMDIDVRTSESKRFFEEISLDNIRSNVDNPDWWNYSRPMLPFILLLAEHINAKYIIPTDISMVYGIIQKYL